MLTRRQVMAGATALAALSGVARAAGADHPKEVRIGYQRNGLLLLAKTRGTFEAKFAPLGIEVKWNEFSFGPPLLEALGTGNIDYGTTGDSPPIFAQAAKANIVYVAAQEAAGSNAGILVPPGSTIQTLADLKGKKIGFARASSSHNLTIAALEKAGIAWTDITPVELAPADARAAFARGDLDAWTIWDPFFAVAEGVPGVRVLALATGISLQNSFFLANRDFVTKYPDTVALVNTELAELAVWAANNRPELVKLYSEATKVDPAAWQRAVDRTEFAVSPVFPHLVESQQRIADRFQRLGLIPNRIEVQDAVWDWVPTT